MPPLIAWTVWSSIFVIALSVWALLLFFARRSALKTDARRRFARSSGIYLLVWVLLSLVLASGGVFQATTSRNFPAIALGVSIPILAGAFLLYRSPALKAVIAAIPLSLLVGIQFYRTLGLNFLALYTLGRLPGEFAIPAGAGDVVVGLAAPVVGYLFHKGYRRAFLVGLAWNTFGILDLVVAVATGFLTSPGPFQRLALDEPNALISASPLVLVPIFAVPLSILLHVAALKRLRAWSQVESDRKLKLKGDFLTPMGSRGEFASRG